MTGYQTLFVVGCPRSGTTWVQLLLAEQGGVATAPETQIFAYYLDHFRKQWIHEHEGPGARLQGRAGLSRLLSQEEFDELCRSTARRVLDRIADENPGASWVVEKSPRHGELIEWILHLFPDAWVLHVIRDPRDVGRSLMRAARTWGRDWAPRGPVGAARMWREAIVKGRRAAEITPRYREIRFEDVKADPEGALHGLLEWLDLPRSRESVAEAVKRCELDQLRDRARDQDRPIPGEKSPEGFFGSGSVGGWRSGLSRSATSTIEGECHDLMEELDYAPRIAIARRRTFRGFASDAVRRIRDAVDWRLQILEERL